MLQTMDACRTILLFVMDGIGCSVHCTILVRHRLQMRILVRQVQKGLELPLYIHKKWKHEQGGPEE